MAAGRSTKDKEMAAHLRQRGIYHGRRLTTTAAPPVPSMSHVGSAAYRRRTASKRALRTAQGGSK